MRKELQKQLDAFQFLIDKVTHLRPGINGDRYGSFQFLIDKVTLAKGDIDVY